jgi:putative tryptophan/tyrosine transport system substrate-binding protein
MIHSIVISGLAILLMSAPVQLAQAQQSKRIPTIGFLTASSPDPQRHLIQAFRQGLLDLGYVEGQNVALEIRAAEGKYDRLPALANELVSLKADVIFAASAPAIGAAKKAAGSIPIVFETLSDPVADGFVDSLARPGGNLTGLAGLAPELSGKRLELLRDIVPGLTRVGVLLNPNNQTHAGCLRRQKITRKHSPCSSRFSKCGGLMNWRKHFRR